MIFFLLGVLDIKKILGLQKNLWTFLSEIVYHYLDVYFFTVRFIFRHSSQIYIAGLENGSLKQYCATTIRAHPHR